MPRHRKLIACLAVVATTATACGDGGSGGGSDGASGASGGDTGSVKMAFLTSISGDLQSFGIDGMNGAQMAVDEINDDGGFVVDGTTYTFDFEVTDLQSDPTVVPAAAQETIQGYGAKIILGATLSSETDPIISAVRRAGDVMLLSPATIMDQFVGQGEPLFRLQPPDPTTAEQYIPVLREEFPDITNVAGLMINDTIGQSILDEYPPVFEDNGFSVTSTDSFPPDEANFLPLLQRASGDTDAFFIGYNATVMQGIIDAAIESNRPRTFFTRGDTCATGLVYEDRIDAYTCIIYLEDPLQPSSPEVAEFFERYGEQFDIDVMDPERGPLTQNSLLYYDYIYLLVQAMQDAGTVDDVDAIADAMRGASYDGVIDLEIDEDGANQTPIRVGIVRDGEYTVINTADR